MHSEIDSVERSERNCGEKVCTVSDQAKVVLKSDTGVGFNGQHGCGGFADNAARFALAATNTAFGPLFSPSHTHFCMNEPCHERIVPTPRHRLV